MSPIEQIITEMEDFIRVHWKLGGGVPTWKVGDWRTKLAAYMDCQHVRKEHEASPHFRVASD